MHAAVYRCVMATSALVLASVIAVTPTASRLIELPVRSIDTGLVDTESLLNVPLNLFYDVINIPANELDAVQDLANALFFSGPWFVPSETNLWGVDVADLPKIEALTHMLVPFPALSDSLGPQLAGVMEAELPTNPACVTVFCGGVFELIHSWFQVPLSQLTSGYYFDPTAPGSVDPLGGVGGEYGFPGTQTLDGIENLYPWAGTTFTLNLSEPWTDLWNSLIAAPAANPIEQLPDPFKVFADLTEGIYVALNPFLPGGPFDPPEAAQFTDLTAATNVPAEFSTLLSGMDSGDLFNVGGLGGEVGALLPDHLGSMLLSLF
jgi:hypothetical protein